MKRLTQFDPFLQWYNAPFHATYMSYLSQNEIITCISEEITENIMKEIRFSNMFALKADEGQGRHSEQLAVYVRYVKPEGRDKENFLGLFKLRGFDAQPCCTDAVVI